MPSNYWKTLLIPKEIIVSAYERSQTKELLTVESWLSFFGVRVAAVLNGVCFGP